MTIEVLIVLALGMVGVFGGLVYSLYRSHGTENERPVLPSHYSSLRYIDQTRYPGHCPNCGTDNEPRYSFCESCGSRIPTGREYSTRSDVGSIFEE